MPFYQLYKLRQNERALLQEFLAALIISGWQLWNTNLQ